MSSNNLWCEIHSTSSHLREVVVVAAVVAGDVAGEGVDVLRPLLAVVRPGEGVGEVVGSALLEAIV